MPNDLRFTKIRYDGETVELEFEEKSGKDYITSTLRSKSAPDPEFEATLSAMKPELLKILQLDRKYGEDVTVRSVAIKYAKDERSGIVITATKPLRLLNAPFVINSPHLPEPNEDGSAGGMSSDLVRLLNRLEELAEHYKAGERAQGEMFDNEDEKPQPRRREKQDDIEEQIEDEKGEARRRIVARESERVLRAILPAEWTAGNTDNDIAAALLDVFDAIEFTDEHEELRKDRTWPGLILHKPEDPASLWVWCQVRTDNGVPAFWYDVDPEHYNATVATLRGKALFALVRKVYGLTAPEAPRIEGIPAVPEAPAEGESDEDWLKRIRPRPESRAEKTAILLQAVHSVIADSETAAAWRELAQKGADDDGIALMLETLLIVRGKSQPKFGWTEALGIHNNERAIEYVEIEVTTSPLSFTIDKGRKREKVEREQLIQAIRAWLDIPQPTAQKDEGLPWDSQHEARVAAADETEAVPAESGAAAD